MSMDLLKTDQFILLFNQLNYVMWYCKYKYKYVINRYHKCIVHLKCELKLHKIVIEDIYLVVK